MIKSYYGAVYKMNVPELVEQEKRDYLEEYESDYFPADGDGKCILADEYFLFMMDNDWYCMLVIEGRDEDEINAYLDEAYNDIGSGKRWDGATCIFKNYEIV